MLDVLDSFAIRRWSAAASVGMDAQQDAIDKLNVYPVPDGDTGTNLATTLRAAAAGVDAERSTAVGDVLHAMARGAVLGARGNSGVILAQILRGMADALGDQEVGDADGLKKALAVGADRAYAAVAEPVEGTILSVARAAAHAGDTAGAAVADVVSAALAGARTALELTTSQLEQLRAAGVVDAGGCGLVVILEALAHVVTGIEPEPLHDAGPRPAPGPRSGARGDYFEYEVQYLLDADSAALDALKARLLTLGDCLVVAGPGGAAPGGVGAGADVWNVHVHVDDAGAAIEAGLAAGRPHRISVTRLAAPGSACACSAVGVADVGVADVGVADVGVAIVAVAPGPGVGDVFRAEGVLVVDGGPDAVPSIHEVLDVIRSAAVRTVILLPITARIDAVAEAAAEAARAEGLVVAVVPTRSPVQGLAAVAVHVGTRRFEDDVITMAAAAAATRWAQVTVADREALTMAGHCYAGDVLGLIEGEVVEIGSDVATVGCSILARLLGVGGDLVTLLLGAGCELDLGEEMTRRLAAIAPHAEADVHFGGQPEPALLIGVE